MAPTLREAREDDAPDLSALLAELGHPAAPGDVRARLARLAREGPATRALVAEEGGRVIGLAVTHVTPVLHRAADVARVTALVVKAEARGRGVGAALVAECERRLAALGFVRMEITSAHAAAGDFYRRLGYADDGVRFAKRIGG